MAVLMGTPRRTSIEVIVSCILVVAASLFFADTSMSSQSVNGSTSISRQQPDDPPDPPPQDPRRPSEPQPPHERRTDAERDSFLTNIRHYTQMVHSLRESLAVARERSGDMQLRNQDEVNRTLEQYSGTINELRHGLAGLDLRLEDESVVIGDQQGELINLRIPEGLGEQISRGIVEISRGLLNELPDTVRWDDFVPDEEWELPQFGRRSAQRRQISGDAIKLWDDNFVEEDEEVLGHVVTVFGNSLISGRVDGNVVVIFGDLEIDDGAEISGKAVSVLGRLARSPDAEVGSVLVIDPFGFGGIDNIDEWFLGGPLTVLLLSFLLIVNYLLLVVLIVLIPDQRFAVAEQTLATRTGGSLGFGFTIALLSPIVLLILCAILVITVIGIPLALLLLLAAFLLGVCALALVSIMVGRRVASLLHLNWTRPPGLALLGLLTLFLPCCIGVLISLIPAMSTFGLVLGMFGLCILFLAGVIGLGAIVVSRFGSRPAALIDEPSVGTSTIS